MPHKTKATLYKDILHARTLDDGWGEVEHVLLWGKWLGTELKAVQKSL